MNRTASSQPIARVLLLWGLCLIENAFFLPLFVLAYIYLVPEHLSLVWLCSVPLLSLAGVMLRNRLFVLWKRAGVSLLLGSLGAVAAFGGLGGNPAICVVIGTLIAYQGLTSAGRVYSTKLYWIGLGLYLLAGIFFPKHSPLAGAVPLLTWFGVLCLAWTLFIYNRSYLKYSTLAKESAGHPLPRGLKGHNAIWIGVIVALAVLLAAGAGRWIGGGILYLLNRLISLLNKPGEEPEPIQETNPEPPIVEPELMEQVQEPGWLTEFLNVAFYAFGTIVLIGIVIVVLYWLYKNAGGIFRTWMDRLLGLLRRTVQKESEAAFVDEETRLKFWETGDNKWRTWRDTFISRFIKRERWEELPNNRERVRYLYRRLLKEEQADGYVIKPHFTPRETENEINEKSASAPKRHKNARLERRTAADQLINLYYRTRYGDQELSKDEVDSIKDDLQL